MASSASTADDVGHSIDQLVAIVRREIEPSSDRERAAWASYHAVVGRANTKLRASRNEIDHLLRAAIRSGALVEWASTDGRWFVPAEEDALHAAIGEENGRADPSIAMIEHCADAIDEVRES